MPIEQLLLKSGMLATAPQVASKLNRLVKRQAYLGEIVDLVQYDPGLTARILQVCNTPAYRGRSSITSLEEAISRLGNATISRIVWQVSMGSRLSGPLSAYGMAAGSLWRHSMTTAIAAEELWKMSDLEEDVGTAFTAGLLHDVGKTLTNVAMANKDAVFRQYIENEKMEVFEAETALLGFNHADLSGRLLEKWGQGEPLISSVTFHHNPEQAGISRFATLICVANHCAHQQEEVLLKKKKPDELHVPEERLEALQINKSSLAKVMEAIQTRTEEVEVLVAIM